MWWGWGGAVEATGGGFGAFFVCTHTATRPSFSFQFPFISKENDGPLPRGSGLCRHRGWQRWPVAVRAGAGALEGGRDVALLGLPRRWMDLTPAAPLLVAMSVFPLASLSTPRTLGWTRSWRRPRREASGATGKMSKAGRGGPPGCFLSAQPSCAACFLRYCRGSGDGPSSKRAK